MPLQRLEGTIQKICFTASNEIKDTHKMIARIRTVAGEEKTVDGNVNRNAEIGDYIIGNFNEQLNSTYGQQYKSGGLIEIYPPRDLEAIHRRCRSIATKHHIKITPTIKSIIDSVGVLDFWKSITTVPRPADTLNGPRFEIFRTAVREHNRRFDTPFVSSMDIEQYIRDLGLSWSEKTIRLLTGHEEDCENPDRVPISKQQLVEDPFVLMTVPGIKTNHIEEYLTALERLHIIDKETVGVGTLIKKCRIAESKNDSCIPVVESVVAPLRSHHRFIEYLCEYNNYLYRTPIFKNEERIAEFVVDYATEEPSDLADPDMYSKIRGLPPDGAVLPTDDQCRAVAMMFNQRMTTLTGGAGSGKTTTLRLLGRTIKEHFPEIRGNILFLAPTGKAVQRMEDSTKDIGLTDSDNIMTIHRFSGSVKTYFKLKREGSEKSADECIRHPLMIVLDESSMICMHTLSMLIQALENYTHKPHIVFMGDECQLMPVGIGTPFIDILQSQTITPHSLKVVHRQGSGSSLLSAVTEIRARRKITAQDATFQIRKITFDSGIREMLEWVDSHKGTTAIIVPTGDIVDQLTPIIRDHMNPATTESILKTKEGDEIPYRKGDIVMQTKNNYRRTVYNGTMGVVEDMVHDDEGYKIRVRFTGRDNDFYYKLSEADKELQLAYVMTTHKAQGSEYDHTLVVMDRLIPGFIHRNLIYTAASRGKKSVVIMIKEVGIMSLWKDVPMKPTTNLIHQILSRVEITEDQSPVPC